MEKREMTAFNRALADVILEEFADIPNEQDLGIRFSENFEKNYDALLNVNKPSRSAVRRVVLVAAILTALMAAALTVYAFREPLIKFFTRDAGTHYEFQFVTEQGADMPEHLEAVYKPTYLPEGFILKDQAISSAGVGFVWYNLQEERYSQDIFKRG